MARLGKSAPWGPYYWKIGAGEPQIHLALGVLFKIGHETWAAESELKEGMCNE
jgi:hypothetical protein